MPERLLIGLMSGTSADGIDAALVSCGAGIALKASLDFPLPADIKQEIVDISHSGSAEIERSQAECDDDYPHSAVGSLQFWQV